MPAPFAFDRTWTFGVGARRLWEVLADPAGYVGSWPWLRRCDLTCNTLAPARNGDAANPVASGAAGNGTDPGIGLEPGSVARCEVRAPLPYSLHFTVTVDEVEPARRVSTTVRGDLAGPARLEITPDGPQRCSARLVWEVELRDPVLRRLAVVGRPAMVWAHDRVVEVGVDAFRRDVLLAPAH